MTAARRHHIQDKADPLQALLRQPSLRQLAAREAAYAASVVGQVNMLIAINEQVAAIQAVMSKNFEQHPAAQIYRSQPGLGPVLAATCRVNSATTRNGSRLPEHERTTPGKARSLGHPGRIRRSRPVATNRRLGVALHLQAIGAPNGSAGTRAYYDAIRARQSAPAGPATTPLYARSPTDSSASCTDAWQPAPSTTKP